MFRAFEIDQAVPYLHYEVQKSAPKSSQELLEVHRGGCQDRDDLISGSTLQAVTFQPVFVLQMSDAWFDCGTAFHTSPSCFRCTSSLSLVDVHGDRAVIVVASIAHVHVHFADLVGDQAFHLLHLCSQRVAVIGISSEAFGTNEPPTAA